MEPNRGSIEARGGGLYPPVRNIDSLCEHLRETFTGSIDRWTMTEDLFPPPSLPPFLLSPSCRFVAGIRNKFEREFKVRVNSFIRNGGKGAWRNEGVFPIRMKYNFSLLYTVLSFNSPWLSKGRGKQVVEYRFVPFFLFSFFFFPPLYHPLWRITRAACYLVRNVRSINTVDTVRTRGGGRGGGWFWVNARF